MLRILRSREMLPPPPPAAAGAAAAAAACRRCMSTAILPSVESPILPSLRSLPLTGDERAILEDRLDYTFTNHTFLDDALTHTSYPKRGWGGNRYSRYYPHIGGHTLRSYKPFKVIGEHAIYDKLKSDNSRFLLNLNLSPHHLARTAIRLKLFDSLRHNSPKLDLQVHDFIKEQQDFVPYRCIPPKVPRVLPDLVHAMLGAIIVDCDNKFDLAWQKMRLYLEPFFLYEDLKKQVTFTALSEILEEHNLSATVHRKTTGPIWTTKVTIKGSLHGLASATSQSESDKLAFLEAINKLPKYMLTGTVYDTPFGIKDKIEPFFGTRSSFSCLLLG